MLCVGGIAVAIGERIKRIRNLRKLTQKELGLAIGFDENTADVRVAQYESGTRTPKEDMLQKIAEVLDVNYRSIYEPTLYAAEDVMYTLFELDEHYGIQIHDDPLDDDPTENLSVCFGSRLINDFLYEWRQRKKDLADGVISKAEYMEWKLNWPQSAGKSPTKQWRKPPDENNL
jgi:transcriptional regulator with XRE-family HTH domain